MAPGRDAEENTQNSRGPEVDMVTHQDKSPGGPRTSRSPVIFNQDFFVEKLRNESPEVFLELVLSNITRLIDLPGAEFAQLLGDESPKTPTGGNGFFRSFNFLKRKDKGVGFGASPSESCIAQIYKLVEYLSKNLHVEGLFRVPGNSGRQQALRELLASGADVDLDSGGFHPNDAATLLKALLGELPEPLLTQRHFHAHLKIADMTLLDERGNKTSVPNKERQLEALQLLLLLLPPSNRSLLKLLLDLLYHTARQQDRNKMSAFNLALMFAPHLLWPRHMNAGDLKDNMKKLNSSMAFIIKHSQKLFRPPVYLRDFARMHFMGSKSLQFKDLPAPVVSTPPRLPLPQKRTAAESAAPSPAQQYTEEALKELFRHVHENMPDSAKKKKLVRQLVKQTPGVTPSAHQQAAAAKKHPRSRSFGGLIKRRARGEQPTAERRLRHASPDALATTRRKSGKENAIFPEADGALAPKNPDVCSSRNKALKGHLATRTWFSPSQEISL